MAVALTSLSIEVTAALVQPAAFKARMKDERGRMTCKKAWHVPPVLWPNFIKAEVGRRKS
jgi:hypothetical protein